MQQQQHQAAAAAAAEVQEPALDMDGLDGFELAAVQQQQRRRLAAAAAAAESQQPALDDTDWATAELAATAAMQSVASGSSSSSSRGNGTVVVPASLHRMLSVIKPDNRLPCPAKTFPFYAMGQIKAKASDGGFVCSGGLIGSNRVLTAGHCVWDDRNAQGPFKDLRFAPGQWKVGTKVESPFGFVDWDYVTLFDSYINDPDGEGLPFDVAVITLTKPVGTELGWLGVRANAPPCRPTPLALNLAGYPGEDPENPRVGGWTGGCYYDRCDVTFSCSVSITNHTCDSYVGQSGAPMYDDDNYVRAVHTLGVLPGFSSTNGAITIQKFMLDNVMGYWRDTDGYTQTKSASQAKTESAKRGKRLTL
jgi:V8-like Glu-specific endopeptidase